jgi:acetyl-CoA carboxylase biotin carboxyl carrier protein
MFPEVAAEFFRWRAKPEDERELSPADIEMIDSREPQQTAASSSAKELSPLVHNNDYQGIGYIVSQSAGLALDEITIKKGDFELHLRTSGAAPARTNTAPANASTTKTEAPKAETSAPKSDYDWSINSPIAGTFYAAPGPNKPKFVEIGKEIKQGDVVCTVEAMKLFNEIKSEKGGTVAEILVKDGEVVQKGQALVGIKN